MVDFKLDDAHVALMMRCAYRRTEDLDDARHAAFAELSRQIKEAGGPDGDLEQQLRDFFAKDARIADLVEAQRSESASLATLRARLSIASLPTDPDALSAELEQMRESRERATGLFSDVVKERNDARIDAAMVKAELQRTSAANDIYSKQASEGALLGVMLRNYSLPCEPKALAAAIERERKACEGRIRELEAQLAARPIGIPDPPPPPPPPTITINMPSADYVLSKIGADAKWLPEMTRILDLVAEHLRSGAGPS